MDWRFQQQIDTILEEDFSDLEQRFPVDLSEVDKSGRVGKRFTFWIYISSNRFKLAFPFSCKDICWDLQL